MTDGALALHLFTVGCMSDHLPVERPEAPTTPSASPVPALSIEGMEVAVVRDSLLPGTAPAPVAAQRSSHVNAAKLESEKVVVAAPLSFAGSAARIWKITGMSEQPAARAGLAVAAVLLIACAWTFVAAWYLTFGLLVVPYRLIRRGQRKRKREALMHREQLAAMGQLANRQ
jgi:hypothetical protein